MSLKIEEVAQRLSGVKIIIHRFFKPRLEGFEDLASNLLLEKHLHLYPVADSPTSPLRGGGEA